jgi:VanZ family protein
MSMTGSAEIKKAILRWLPAVAWMGLIFFLSSRPDLPHAPEYWLDVLWKKGAHFGAYAVLAFLLEYALDQQPRAKLLALCLAILYAISDEFHQSFTPNRTPTASDVLIDTLGALFALYVLPLLLYWRKSSKLT